MKTKLVPLIGDPIHNLYQLGMRERESFLKLEERVSKLLSMSSLLRHGQEIISRTKLIFKKKEEGFFQDAIKAYAEGMGIEPTRYHSFLSLFEMAAHYGHVYPELKSLLPGCTSVLAMNNGEVSHTRLLDFPLVGLFDEAPRLYYWKPDDSEGILTYSMEGMAPVFLQGIHSSGTSFALHHKPGHSLHHDGQNIFHITFEILFKCKNLSEFKKEIKKKSSVTKWSFIFLEKDGQALAMDIDGPSQSHESYHLKDTSPLIFTNIPLQNDSLDFKNFIAFSKDRQNWTKDKLKDSKGKHILDLMTDVSDQKNKNWRHPASTLATVGAYHINLTKGYVDLKEGSGNLTQSDAILKLGLSGGEDLSLLKEAEKMNQNERAWKRAGSAQSYFDQGKFDKAYHELQMARSLTDNKVWKEIYSLYLYVWDFKFIGNNKELSMVYKDLKKLQLPALLHDQWVLTIMRYEKKLGLSPTVFPKDVSKETRDLFVQEKEAKKPVFATWMKLLYPRMEILEIFSPHQK